MADSTFDLDRFLARLATRRMGREIQALAEVGSTNDAAWEAGAAGAGDGFVVVSDAQHRGRGRDGRHWHTTPGKGLAMSVLLSQACDRRPLGVLPLAAGLALARACDALGVAADLKWPNDLVVGGGKLGGILAESRTLVAGSEASRAAVVGVGVNVAQSASDFPAELGPLPPVSLRMMGHEVTREEMAAAWLDAFEPLWLDLERAGAGPMLEAWIGRATFWGETLSVRTPAGQVAGRARTLDADGALVLETSGGAHARILMGDVVPAGDGARRIVRSTSTDGTGAAQR